MKKHILVLLLAISQPCTMPAQKSAGSKPAAPPSAPIPQWLLDDWAARTSGTGTWITDNSAYQSDSEPYEAYGLQWEYGLGKKSLKGLLYCIQDGKDIGSVWQFLEFWDPAAGEVRILQIGSDGTVGQGKAWRLDDGSSKSQQAFASPDGGTFESGHHSWMEDGANHTQSYNIVDGEWVKRRYYIWKSEKE